MPLLPCPAVCFIDHGTTGAAAASARQQQAQEDASQPQTPTSSRQPGTPSSLSMGSLSVAAA